MLRYIMREIERILRYIKTERDRGRRKREREAGRRKRERERNH